MSTFAKRNGVMRAAMAAVGGIALAAVAAMNGVEVGVAEPVLPPVPELLHWPFTDGSGSTITVSVGPHGTTDADWITGPNGQPALVFNGTTDNAATATPVAFGSAVLTFCAWLKFDNLSPTQILLESSANSNSNPYTCLIFVDSGSLYVNCVATSGAAHVGGSVVLPDDGEWHHVVVAMNGSFDGGVLGLWIDAVPLFPPHSATSWVVGNFSTQTVNVGARGGSSLFFDGAIADLRIYNRELTQAEVQAISGLTPAALPVDFLLRPPSENPVTAEGLAAGTLGAVQWWELTPSIPIGLSGVSGGALPFDVLVLGEVLPAGAANRLAIVNAATLTYATGVLPGGVRKLTQAMPITLAGAAGADGLRDILNSAGSITGHEVIAQTSYGAGAHQIKIECGTSEGTTHSGEVALPDGEYFLELRDDRIGGIATLRVWDAGGDLVADLSLAQTTGETIGRVRVGNAEFGTGTGSNLLGPVMASFTGARISPAT